MADVQPFRGLRFTAAAVPDIGRVLCPPYDVIDAGDDARLREQHPYNVVRLELTTASVAGGNERRYQDAADTLRGWRADGALVREAAPAYYLHEATFTVPGHENRQYTRRELIAAVGVEPWANRAVLPHELTYPRAKADRLRLLAATETNLSPILVFFNRDATPDSTLAAVTSDAVDAAWDWTADREPDAVGADADGVGHRLWVLHDAALVDGLRAFFASRPLFIADGHHRYETALNYLEDCRQQAGGELPPDHPARFVMMHLIAEDDPGLVILPLHRLISGLGSLEFWQFVKTLESEFQVEIRDKVLTDTDLEAALTRLRARGENGSALALFPPEDSEVVLLSRPPDSPIPAAIPADRDISWRSLDVVLLDYTIVRPLLAAHHLHAEDAIAYTRDAADAVRQVRSGKYDIAVLVNPTRVEQVAAVALAGERMPEKSTYFFPKAPTGLVFRPLE